MEKRFEASCDRIEEGIAVLTDGDGVEYTVRSPLSAALYEGGYYLCVTDRDGKTVVSVTHLSKKEEEQREKARSIWQRLFEKK